MRKVEGSCYTVKLTYVVSGLDHSGKWRDLSFCPSKSKTFFVRASCDEEAERIAREKVKEFVTALKKEYFTQRVVISKKVLDLARPGEHSDWV